jgi:hypothetical protein
MKETKGLRQQARELAQAHAKERAARTAEQQEARAREQRAAQTLAIKAELDTLRAATATRSMKR